MYFNQLILRIPRLSQFITRTGSLARFEHARVEFGESHVFVDLYEGQVESESRFALQISCQGLDWQISHMTHVLYQSSALLSHVNDLSIDAHDLHPGWRADIHVEPSEWLGLLRPFTAIETLRVSKQLAGYVAVALDDITGEKVAEILPALRSLSLEDQPESAVGRYIEALRNSDCPVNVSSMQGRNTEVLVPLQEKSKHDHSPQPEQHATFRLGNTTQRFKPSEP